MYSIRGKVKKGKGRGEKLGFPTANIPLHKKIPSGIYISLTRINSIPYPSITFIGEAKTFNENVFQLETYILDFSKLIYNKWITVQLLKKVRENIAFSSEYDLIKQMEEDKEQAEKYFREKEPYV